MDLYIGPRRRRRRSWLLLVVVLLVAALVSWRFGWLPEDVLRLLEQNIARVIAGAPSQPETAAKLPEVTRDPKRQFLNFTSTAYSVATPLAAAPDTAPPPSDAYTAALYEETRGEREIPWANAGGRANVETYIVEEGDTLWSIAAQFELDIDTLRWSNAALEHQPDILSLNTELVILPVQGVYHIVAAGDTVANIAAVYGVAEADITRYPPNALYPPFNLKAGEGVIVPFGRKELYVPQPALAANSPLAWPVTGPITQGYQAGHSAIDIGGPYGSTVYAAAAGEITFASWAETGYGYTLILDHGHGLETWYSHLKGTLLQSGFVERGTPIGEIGGTGNSSGPHVHFEVRMNGAEVDPLEYLPNSPN